jgi:hypothetical protein
VSVASEGQRGHSRPSGAAPDPRLKEVAGDGWIWEDWIVCAYRLAQERDVIKAKLKQVITERDALAQELDELSMRDAR